MKKQLSILLLPLIACSTIIPLVTSCKVAPTPLDHLDYAPIGDTDNIAITGFRDKYRNATELNIQPTYKISGKTYSVTQIGDYDKDDFAHHSNFGFYHNHLKKVILPSTIKRITDFAFAEQRCPWTMDDSQSEDLRDNWVTNFDLSKCNDLEYIGAYAFQCDTFNELKLPKNNHALTSLGDAAFSGVRFYHDLDFRGFKSLRTIGEWEFYAAENGEGGYGGKKILLPVNDQYTMMPNTFTWSDADAVYFNTTEFPEFLSTEVNHNPSDGLGMTLSHFSFALSDFKEVHVQRGANLDEWATGIDDNAGKMTIPIINWKLPELYHVGKLIADLNPDGSQGNPTAIKINLGPSWLNGIPFDLAFKGILEYILQLPLIDGPWGDDKHLYDLTDMLVQADQYINDVDPSNEEAKTAYDLIVVLLENPSHNIDDDPWSLKMVQCEIFCIWDRVFKYK